MDRLDALLHRFVPAHAARSRPCVPAAQPTLRSVRNTSSVTLQPSSARPAGETAADPLQAFAVPPDEGRLLVALCRQHRKALDPDYHLALAAPHRAAVDSFFAKRATLLRAVLAAAAAPADGAAAKAWPDIRHLTSRRDILKQLLRTSAGLVVGEAHASKASKRLLIDHMRLLRTLGIDTLYMEHLQGDIHQADLDALHRQGTVSPALKRFLSEQDQGHMTDPESGATFSNVVATAARAGLRIVALDLMTSYHLKGAEHEACAGTAPSNNLRTRVMNHVGVARIQHDQCRAVANCAPRRWLALVGNTHAGTFNGIDGIAGRLGVPSLRVEDVHDANAPRVQAGIDPGLSVPPSALRAHGQLRCDYLLKVRSPT
jgi:hypothetical protein